MYATVLLALRTKKTYPNYQPQKQIVKMVIKLKFRSEPMTDVPPHGTSVKLTQTLNTTFRLSRKFNNLHGTCQSQFLLRLGATFTSQKVLFPHKIIKKLDSSNDYSACKLGPSTRQLRSETPIEL